VLENADKLILRRGSAARSRLYTHGHTPVGCIFTDRAGRRGRVCAEKRTYGYVFFPIFPPSPLESYVFFPFPPLPLRIVGRRPPGSVGPGGLGKVPNRLRYYYNPLTVHTKAHLRFSTRRTRAKRVYCPRWAFWLLCPRGIERPRGARCCARTRVGFTIFCTFLALGLPTWPSDPKMIYFS